MPYWLDVRNCKSDPVFDAPGGGKPGSRYETSETWTVPQSGRIVAAGGHVHGGAYGLRTTMPDCDDRELWDVEPAWGRASHPFYNVKPVLHEPGPIATSAVMSNDGWRVAKGERVRLTASYDNARPHTRAMGIQLLYLAPDEGVTERVRARRRPTCASTAPTSPHRTRPAALPRADHRPRRDTGRAVEIKRAPGQDEAAAHRHDDPRSRTSPSASATRSSGAARRCAGASTTPSCTTSRWPTARAASRSDHLSDGRTYSKRLTTPGKYKLFCGLHPVSMTQTVRVKR